MIPEPIIIALLCAGAGIGRQAWLRAMCRKAWGFNSPPAHTKNRFTAVFALIPGSE